MCVYVCVCACICLCVCLSSVYSGCISHPLIRRCADVTAHYNLYMKHWNSTWLPHLPHVFWRRGRDLGGLWLRLRVDPLSHSWPCDWHFFWARALFVAVLWLRVSSGPFPCSHPLPPEKRLSSHHCFTPLMDSLPQPGRERSLLQCNSTVTTVSFSASVAEEPKLI